LSELALDPESDLILYLCSSTSISPNEIEFVRQWHDEIRKSADARVAKAAILVRPHPLNKQPWDQLDHLANFAVWPRDSIGPFNPQGRADYFDSIYHAAVVVGLNTSGQVEAGLIGKPVLTLLLADSPLTLRGTTDTLHFQHLLSVNGGLLHVARSFDEHVQHLGRAIAGDPAMVERSRRFTQAFIRPHGMERPAAPILADAIRSVGEVKPQRPMLDRALAPILRPLLKQAASRELAQRRSKKAARKPAPGAVADQKVGKNG
jgi:hypothetical protein